MRKLIRDVYVIALIRSRWIRNQPVLYLGAAFFMPLVFSLLFLMMGGGLTKRILLGSMVYSIVYPAIATVGKSVSYDKLRGSFTLFSTAPISPYAYIIGTTLSTLPSSMMPFLTFMAVSGMLFHLSLSAESILLSLAVLVFGAVSLSFLGFILGSRLRDPKSSDVIIDMAWALMIFLSPVYMPWAKLPDFIKPISLLMPTTYLSELLSYVLWRESFLDIPMLVGANLLFFALFAALAVHQGRMREE